MKIHDFVVNDIDGNEVDLKDYQNKVILVVNTASKCGFTPQYEDLQTLYHKYQDQGLEILAFPCNQFKNQEFENSGEIKSFCSLEYGVSFKIFESILVNGKHAHPVFNYLKKALPFEGFNLNNPSDKLLDAMLKTEYPSYTIGNEIRWNFTKFLIDRQGNPIKRFESSVNPMDIEDSIKSIL